MEEEAQKSPHQRPNTEPCPLWHRGLAKVQGKTTQAQLVKGDTFLHTRYRQAQAAKELGTQIPSSGVGDPRETRRSGGGTCKIS